MTSYLQRCGLGPILRQPSHPQRQCRASLARMLRRSAWPAVPSTMISSKSLTFQSVACAANLRTPARHALPLGAARRLRCTRAAAFRRCLGRRGHRAYPAASDVRTCPGRVGVRIGCCSCAHARLSGRARGRGLTVPRRTGFAPRSSCHRTRSWCTPTVAASTPTARRWNCCGPPGPARSSACRRWTSCTRTIVNRNCGASSACGKGSR